MKHIVQMSPEKETKGAVRYAEEKIAGVEGIIGTLYIRKSSLPSPAPSEITVTVEG